MGISTGYGRAITSGSIFAFDTADVINSYKGEPTTNLIPYAQYNSYPTYGNGWGTYNTNQYCGNNGCAVYWDIPAITFVSGDVITTATDHPIRSFDVIRPETTGGGVTAGVDYVAKKITNTQFSLHAYNSSQDGSQGYINSATGGHKVHDSYWLDQKVSVNATSFPTKWWGAPHLPNSAIVKEIIPNGFTRIDGRKTDCIRLHWSRPDGVTDGMAYGVDAPLTIGTPVTVSFYARAVDASAVGQYINFSNYNYGGIGGYNYFGMTVTWGAAGEWVRNSYTFTPTHAAIISYWFPSVGNMKVDIANIQVEHKTHATPFTISERSTTDALKPLVSNSSIDLSNVSFDANAQMYFDGTNDYVNLGSYLYNIDTSTLSIELVFKTNTLSGCLTLLGWHENEYPHGYICLGNFTGYWANETISFYNEGPGTTPLSFAYTNGHDFLSDGLYHHVVFILKTNEYKIYVDGTEVAVNASFRNGTQSTVMPSNLFGYGATPSVILGAGSDPAGAFFNGVIPVTKIYNRALSEGEVKQNYNKYKTKFKLS